MDELLVRAWRAFDEAGSLTARELAEAARITRGAALLFLIDWAKTGHAVLDTPDVPPYERRYGRQAASSRAGRVA